MSKSILKKYITTKSYDILFVKLMFYFFKLFGILTISYDNAWKRETESQSFLFKFSWTGTLYSVILIILLLFFNINRIYIIINGAFYSVSEQEYFVLNLLTHIIRIFNMIILSIFVFQPAKVASIANNIYESRRLAAEQYFTKKKILSVYAGNIILSCILRITLNIYLKDDTLYILTFTDFTAHVLFLQYTFLLMILESYYKFINDSLRKSFLKGSNWTLEDHNLNLRIDKLINLNSCLYKASIKFSKFYSMSMIFATLNFYVYLLGNAHKLIKELFITNDYAILNNLISFVNFYLSFLLLAVLVTSVTNTMREVMFHLFNFHLTTIFAFFYSYYFFSYTE